MYLKDYFFNIHYCNGRKLKDSSGPRRRITRTLQHHELILATGGSGCITIDGRKYQIQPGMLFYIAPGILHTFELSGNDLPYVMTVHFSYAYITHTDGCLDISNEAPILTIPSGQQLKDYYQVEELFKKLVDTWHAKGLGYEFITKTLLQQLLIAIWQNVRKQDQMDATSLKIEKTIAYMQQNLSRKMTLHELANRVQWSPTYLSRTFKGITGYAVIEYFNKMKMDQAKEFMLEGDKKIKEVAQAVGYTDEFYFSRMFRKIEGMSPSEFYSKYVHGE